MAKSQDDFLRELLEDFKVEAAEHQQAITESMLLLEKQPPAGEYQKIVETTFREFHSLKGAARAVNQGDVERLCQAMEGIFHQLKDGRAQLTPSLFDLLFKGVDALNAMLLDTAPGNRVNQGNNLAQLLKAIENQINIPGSNQPSSYGGPSLSLPQVETVVSNDENQVSLSSVQPEASPNEQQTHKETVRIATSKLNSILRQSEEFISARAELAYFIEEINRINHPELQSLQRNLGKFSHTFSQRVDELVHDVKSTLLFPFSSLTDIVPKIVRDLGREFGKEIELTITGAETEIDRRILEEMKDPLIHLIRNCIDHGIEKPEVRIKNGKPPRGAIKIAISQESVRKVNLLLCDDGAGIERERLRESALKNSVVTKQGLDQMNDQEILDLIFRSGVSTSPMITDLSGRGLGMAIVAAKVDGLGGSITVESETGKGTCFAVSLPLNLSTFRGIVVSVSNQFFVVPTSAIEQAIRIRTNDIKYAESKPLLSRNGENIALVKLSDALGLSERRQKQAPGNHFPVLITTMAHRKIGFLVDEILGEQEGVVKDFGPQLVHVRNLAGATVLGSGKVIPILHIPELFDSALNLHPVTDTYDPAEETEGSVEKQPRILVAEDSITSRMLIRNILETSGFQVKTAVDGLEAFQFLQNDSFDLVVSDVEMPGMDGFELTSKIRADNRFTAIPVVLVTALSSDPDRQRGLEAGANAYIVKSNFEQSNLVETIQRLI